MLEKIINRLFSLESVTVNRKPRIYRATRFIFGVITILWTLLTLLFLIGAINILLSRYASNYLVSYGIIMPFMWIVDYWLLKKFFQHHQRLSIARQLEGGKPITGFAYRIGYASFFIFAFSFLIAIGGIIAIQLSFDQSQQKIRLSQTAIAYVQATDFAYATQTATLWTPTNTNTPTLTFTPSNTPTITDTPTITNTPTSTFTPSNTPTATNTATITNTPQPTNTTLPSTTTYYINSSGSVNTRECPQTTCARVISLSSGEAIQVISVVSGEIVSGIDKWYEATYQGRTIYVHSSLASRNKPIESSNQIKSTAIPVQQVQSPISTVAVQSEAPAQPAFSCNCSKTCPAMVSCEEAYFQLNTCGCGRRDGDGDGVPCEDICPGG